MVRLNIGCGTDYRDGFVNIDGSDALPRVDLVLDLGTPMRLIEHFGERSVHHILANDIVEHLFRWEAVSLLGVFFRLLVADGGCEIRVPDCDFIINEWDKPISVKLERLFGGQDRPLGKAREMEDTRTRHPEFFCHKYGWTQSTMKSTLAAVGFNQIETRQHGADFVATARRPSAWQLRGLLRCLRGKR